MKNYIKGIVTGAVITATLYTVPAFSEGIDAFFNTVNIRLESRENVVKKDESFTLYNGDILPYSINYKDTVYLPMRKIGELTQKDISWDDSSHTITIKDDYTPLTFEGNVPVISQPDKDGVIHEYSLVESKDNKIYLMVKAHDSSESISYLIDKSFNGTPAIKATDDGLLFVRLKKNSYYTFPEIVHLPYLSDSSTRNGEIVMYSESIRVEEVFFDGDYFYFAGVTAYGLNPNSMLMAVNAKTLEQTYFIGSRQPLYDIFINSSDENNTVFHYYTSMMDEYSYMQSITFNKDAFTFEKPVDVN